MKKFEEMSKSEMETEIAFTEEAIKMMAYSIINTAHNCY